MPPQRQGNFINQLLGIYVYTSQGFCEYIERDGKKWDAHVWSICILFQITRLDVHDHQMCVYACQLGGCCICMQIFKNVKD